MRYIGLLIFAFLIAIPFEAQPHGGGLDDLSCHTDSNAANYHCHGGPLDGLSFASKEDAKRALAGSIRIATFNIQIFGETKASKPEVMEQLADIVRAYDVVAIQEIKNAAGNVPGLFLDAINDSNAANYDLLVSERTGKQADDGDSHGYCGKTTDHLKWQVTYTEGGCNGQSRNNGCCAQDR